MCQVLGSLGRFRNERGMLQLFLVVIFFLDVICVRVSDVISCDVR